MFETYYLTLKPKYSYKLNEDRMKENILSECTEEARYLKTLLFRNLQHIDFNTFLKELNKQINIFNKDIGENNYFVCVGNSDDSREHNFNKYQSIKSNIWLKYICYNKTIKINIQISIGMIKINQNVEKE